MAKGIRSLGALSGLQTLVEQFERDGSLTAPDRFRDRVAALERLDAYDLDSHVSSGGSADATGSIDHRALALRSRLEIANSELYDGIRRGIRHGSGHDALMAFVDEVGARDRGANRHGNGDSYDYLDELVNGVLRFAAPEEAKVKLTPEMVAYQPTPARHIFDLIVRTKLTARDVFVDLGSGLGHVALLVAACTQARAVGIELEPSYVECASRCAEELELDNAIFIAQDVREADLSRGTIFYLYTPFRGGILRRVLDRLRAEAKARAIRVCTFGPCTPIVAAATWLTVDAAGPSVISIFLSRK